MNGSSFLLDFHVTSKFITNIFNCTADIFKLMADFFKVIAEILRHLQMNYTISNDKQIYLQINYTLL